MPVTGNKTSQATPRVLSSDQRHALRSGYGHVTEVKPVGTSFSLNSKYNTIAGLGPSAIEFEFRRPTPRKRRRPKNAKASRKPVNEIRGLHLDRLCCSTTPKDQPGFSDSRLRRTLRQRELHPSPFAVDVVFADEEHCERSIPALVRQRIPCRDCTYPYPLRRLSCSRRPSADGLGRYSADNLANTIPSSLVDHFRACVKGQPGFHILADLGGIIRSQRMFAYW